MVLSISTTHAVKIWQPLGPSPIYGGQPENIPNKPQVGAINAIAPHPTNANILYVATVAGGIWKTENALDTEPSWLPLTDVTQPPFFDPQESLSTSDVAIDLFDVADFSTLVASFGRYSSFNNNGGYRMGIIRSIDHGETWTKISGTSGVIMDGKNINSVKPYNGTILAAVDAADINACNQLGIFATANTGETWFHLGSANGIIQGRATALEADPITAGTYYAGINKIDCGGAQSGIYKTTDFGLNWSLINDVAINSLLNTPSCIAQNDYVISVGRQNNVYAGIICSDSGRGRLSGVFRSGNGGVSWTQMALPGTTEFNGFQGIHPGGQGFLHRSIVADPINSNIVYIGGDRQPSIPSTLGNLDFSGRIFRGDASLSSGFQWSPLTHSGTASNSSTHADSRDMMFDANGTLLEVDDGGIYRMLAPRTSTSDWISVNGNMQHSEIHSSDYDSNTNTTIAGFQDNGVGGQSFLSEKKWSLLQGGDGGDVAVDNKSLAAQNKSIRYMSSQELGGFNRRTFNQNNELESLININPTVINGGNPLVPAFLTHFVLNNNNPQRMIIGGRNSIYESFDQGNTINEIGPGIIASTVIARAGSKTIAYGNNTNANILYVAGFIFNGSNGVFVRTTSGGPLVFKYSTSNAASNGVVNSIVVNDNNDAEAFLVEDAKVMRTTNYGDNWTDITGNLASANGFATIGKILTVEFIDGSDFDGLVVGTEKGVFLSASPTNYVVWEKFGVLRAPVPVYSLEYNKQADVIVAGTFGRGEYIVKAPLSANEAPQANPFNQYMNLPSASSSSNLSDGTTNLLDKFSDVNQGQTLSIQTTPIKQPSNGLLTINSNGTFNYQHDGSMTDVDEFYYRVCDNGIPAPVLCNDAKVNITINDGNKVCSAPNINIPDNNPTGITDTLTMMQSGLINDLDVSLEINHTYVGDLTVKLVQVSTATEVILINRPGNNNCGADDISVELDDSESAFADDQCAAPIAIEGRFKPTGTLSSFNNLELSGNWNLIVTDSVNQDIGALISWCLDTELNGAPVNTAPILNAIGNQSIDPLSNLAFTALAIDNDVPAQKLTFSLSGVVPAGANITPSGGFSFTPTNEQASNVYTFDVIVSDDGTPIMTDSETISVTVNSIPEPSITQCTVPQSPIPDGTGTSLVDTLTITDSGIISDLDVTLDILHPWVGDLEAKLTHVSTGTEVQIILNPGGPNCSADNIQARFGDEFANTTTACEAIDGDYQPVGVLSSFDGELFTGDWNLTVRDSISPDPGTLSSWCLHAVVSEDEDLIFSSGFEL